MQLEAIVENNGRIGLGDAHEKGKELELAAGKTIKDVETACSALVEEGWLDELVGAVK